MAAAEIGTGLAAADQIVLQLAHAVENVLDQGCRYARYVPELLRQIEDQAVRRLGGEVESLFGSVTLRLGFLGGNAGLPPLPAGKSDKDQRREQPDRGAPCRALVGGGERLGVPYAPLLLFPLGLKPLEPLALSCLLLLTALLEILPRIGAEIAGKVLALGELLGLFEPRAGMVQPIRRIVVCCPIECGALYAFECGERPEVFVEPALQQSPLPEQCLMHRLDGDLAGVFGDVCGKQALLDQKVDQGGTLFWDLRVAGDAAARRARVWVNAGKPGDEATPEKGKARLPVPWDLRIIIGCLEGPLDSGLNGAFDPAKLLILGELEIAVPAGLAIEPLQGEGEQRQRILSPALLDVGKERIDQSLFDLERPIGSFKPVRRTFDHFGIRPLRHGRQAQRVLAEALQGLGRL